MSIRQTFNGIVSTTYKGVTFPFRATGRMLYRGTCGIAFAIGRVCVATKNKILSGILAIGRGIQRTVFGIGSAIAHVYRSVINGITAALHGIAVGILSIGRAILKLMRQARNMVAAVAVAAAKLTAMPFIAIYRSIGRLGSGVGSFIGAKYRAFIFNLASTTMTLSLEDGQARLLVFKGDRIIAWKSGQIAQPPAEPVEAAENEPAADSKPDKKPKATVFNPLEALLDDLPARSKGVIIDLPLYLPLLRHVQLPDVKGRYLKEIVNAEVLDSVPFAPNEVDIRWRVEQGEETREASVIAVPKDRMDGHIGIVRDSQLSPSAIYPKAAALAAAVALPDVFILHITGSQTAVILVRGGVPRIVHRLELPQDTTEQAETIAMGVEQVAGYHRSQRPEDNISSLPVVVTGEVKQAQELVGQLSTALDRQVKEFEPELDCPDGFDSAEYAPNIGLFLAAKSSESAKVIATQNVLPKRHSPRPLPVVSTAAFAGLLGLGFLAFVLTGWVSGVAGEINTLNATLNIREDQARDYRLAAARQNVVDRRIAQAELEAQELEANLLILEEEMDTLLSRINDITTNAESSNVNLSRLVPLPEGFSVSGSAGSYSDVLGYAASMRSSPYFEDATVIQVADSTADRLGFTVTVTIPTPEPEEEGTPPQAQSP
ncbi:MAG: hypothetical protein HQ475_10975 [SAR202 cluster bacterium]|nr:hypothetical protein [SAR202 cluster bacterium]